MLLPPADRLGAWVQAAVGPDGFWRRARPAGHFATAASLGPELAAAIAGLLAGRPDVARVVDVGAGDGLLLDALHARRRDLTLLGVDVGDRPPGLAAGVGWLTDCWDVRVGSWTDGLPDRLTAAPGPTLLLATEWLDDLPLPVLTRTVEDGAGLTGADAGWAEQWWPSGAVLEVGRTRDAAWAGLVAALARAGGGLAVCLDYGHLRSHRPTTSTLAGYRDGRPVPPLARPDRNLTAHVAMDAIAAAGEAAGASSSTLVRLGEALAGLWSAASRAGWPEPTEPLAALAAAGRRAALTDPRRWGAQWLLVQPVPAVAA